MNNNKLSVVTAEIPVQQKTKKEKLPVFLVEKGELHKQYDVAESVLSKSGIYHRAGALVAIEEGAIISLKSINLRVNYLAKLIAWEGKKNGFIQPVDPPKEVAEALVSAGNWRTIMPLKAIADHVLLDLGGELLKSGYNHKTGIYVDAVELKIPTTPTSSDVQDAIAMLSSLLQTFDFAMADEDKAGALCAILTAIARPVLPTAPLILIGAPVPGSGKGLLARGFALFACDAEPPAAILADSAEEIHKDLFSRLIVGHPVIFYDEVSNAEIDSPTLRTLATSEVLSGRVLGRSAETTASTNALVLLTGNNIAPTADTARRILQIRLDPQCEKPSTRQYDYDPIADLKTRRKAMISAALTIQRAYLESGVHDEFKKTLPAVGSFDDWNRMCRLPIAWATGSDPAHRMLAALDDDPRRNTMLSVFSAWFAVFGEMPVTSKAVIETAEAARDSDLYEALKPAASDRAGRLATLNLGRWLSKYKDRIVDGLALRDAGKLDGNQRWIITKVCEAGGSK